MPATRNSAPRPTRIHPPTLSPVDPPPAAGAGGGGGPPPPPGALSGGDPPAPADAGGGAGWSPPPDGGDGVSPAARGPARGSSASVIWRSRHGLRNAASGREEGYLRAHQHRDPPSRKIALQV